MKAANREGVTPLAMASLYGNVSMIEQLLKAGADAKERGTERRNDRHAGGAQRQPEAIKLLVAAGADVNAKETARGTTALMWAAEQRHPAAVKALVELGADVAAKSGPAGLPRNYMAPASQRRGRARRRETPRDARPPANDRRAATFEQANGLPHRSERAQVAATWRVAGAARPAAALACAAAAAVARRRLRSDATTSRTSSSPAWSAAAAAA